MGAEDKGSTEGKKGNRQEEGHAGWLRSYKQAKSLPQTAHCCWCETRIVGKNNSQT